MIRLCANANIYRVERTSSRPISDVKHRRVWIAPVWVTIEDSGQMRYAFRLNADWVRLIWIADINSRNWRVRPMSRREI